MAMTDRGFSSEQHDARAPQAKDSKREARIPDPRRIRTLSATSFGWIDARLKLDGWLAVLTPEAVSVYAFLCLAADRNGVSYYGRDRMARVLGLGDRELHLALRRLLELDLIAFRPFRAGSVDGFHQVLPVPPGGPPQPLGPVVEALAERLRLPRPLRGVGEAEEVADAR
jgi:hypothetical protein